MYLDNFISFLRHEKRYSPHTTLSYENDLRQFIQYLQEQYDIQDPAAIKHFHIRSWIVEFMESGITTRTINRKISTLKTYFKYLIKRDAVKTNPMLKVLSPKNSKRLPAYVEKENIKPVFNPGFFTDDFSGKREQLVLELFYCTGMRLSELINLKETDVDLNKDEIKVLGKGNKERIIPININLRQSIQKYLEWKKDQQSSCNHLFITDKGNKLYPKFVYRLVNRFLSMVTTIDKKSPHTLRHTFATHMVDSGADLNAVKELLGHASLAATQVYTHNSIEKLKDVYKNAHPKA